MPPSADAQFSRRLQVNYARKNDDDLYVELQHANRRQVSKVAFTNIEEGDSNFVLPADEKRALKQWIAARYGRPAFPNASENRLRKTSTNTSVEHRIAKIPEPASQHLVALFFGLGEERYVELLDGDPYFLSISVVYDATQGGQTARETADVVAEQLRILFEQEYGTPDVATEVALEGSNAIADSFMTLADLRKVDQWRLEYINLREDPTGTFLPTGNLSV